MSHFGIERLQFKTGILHHITFQARNYENELDTFEAVVVTKNNLEKGEMFMKVQNFKIKKPESIWGTLTDLVAIHTK
ncbi:hypothetical protein Leryth_007288 [Lithospermum erythrorhizon]|nr:hypothetical protein Leryth_007288 [Lithospermum erythrorhizon]